MCTQVLLWVELRMLGWRWSLGGSSLHYAHGTTIWRGNGATVLEINGSPGRSRRKGHLQKLFRQPSPFDSAHGIMRAVFETETLCTEKTEAQIYFRAILRTWTRIFRRNGNVNLCWSELQSLRPPCSNTPNLQRSFLKAKSPRPGRKSLKTEKYYNIICI